MTNVSDNLGTYRIMDIPKPNFKMSMGDSGDVVFAFTVRKTLMNRVKYWLFCLFFPFRIKEWT